MLVGLELGYYRPGRHTPGNRHEHILRVLRVRTPQISGINAVFVQRKKHEEDSTDTPGSSTFGKFFVFCENSFESFLHIWYSLLKHQTKNH
jgi:hypothetical protein